MKSTSFIKTLILLFYLSLSLPSWSYPYTDIYVFGDSLSDTGRLFEAVGKPAAPYYRGHFSNGKLWVEYLAEALNLNYNSRANFAWAGATTGTSNVSVDGLPGLQQQLEDYLKESTAADPEALYVVWAGPNDLAFLSPQEVATQITSIISTSVANIVNVVSKLRTHGAQHIVVPNIPNLGMVPFGLATGMPTLLTSLSATFNQALATALQPLDIIQIDTSALLEALANSQVTLSFAHLQNTTDPCVDSVNQTLCDNPNTYLFWDTLHPTTVVHYLLALIFEAAVEEPYYVELAKFDPSLYNSLYLPLVEVNTAAGKQTVLKTLMLRDPNESLFGFSLASSNAYFPTSYQTFIKFPSTTTHPYPTFELATGQLLIPQVHLTAQTDTLHLDFLGKYTVELNLMSSSGDNPLATTMFQLTNAVALEE